MGGRVDPIRVRCKIYVIVRSLSRGDVMSTFSELRNDHTKTWALIAAGFGIGLLWLAMAAPTLHRSRQTLSMPQQTTRDRSSQAFYTAAPAKSKTAVMAEPTTPA